MTVIGRVVSPGLTRKTESGILLKEYDERERHSRQNTWLDGGQQNEPGTLPPTGSEDLTRAVEIPVKIRNRGRNHADNERSARTE